MRTRAGPARPPFQRLIGQWLPGDASPSAWPEGVEVDPWTVDDVPCDVLLPGDRWYEPVDRPEIAR